MNDNPVNPNDFKVVSFHNAEEFGFTPEMGCMYNGVGINGKNGSPGIDAGESVTLPYHIGQQLALNLAKYTMNRSASTDPQLDAQGTPMIKAIWDTNKLEQMKNSYLTDLYSEARPVRMSESDLLLAKFEEYKKLTDEKIAELSGRPVVQDTSTTTPAPEVAPITGITYKNKQEIIVELEKREIPHNKRDSKETLEKLLA